MTSASLLNQLNIVPRWIIFLIDILICWLALTVAYLVKSNFDLSRLDYIQFSQNILIVSGISAIAFFIVKTYSGIIRYTGLQDSFRILLAVVISNSILFLADIILVAFKKEPFISSQILIINVGVCFILMMTYRFLVKYFFFYVKNLKLDKKRVIIYGAGQSGVAAKRTFDHDYKVNKNIIAFVDDDQRKVGKMIDGIKILDAQNLMLLIETRELDEIIFASYTIPFDQKNKIVDLCLESNINVLNIPPYDVWPSGKLKPAQIQNINIEDLLNRKAIQIDTTSIQNELKGKRILITGAAGSIGSEIVRQLLKFDTGLIIMCDQSETALHHLYLETEDKHANTNFHAFIGDVKDANRMNHLFETYKPHYVYHAAAYKHVPLMEDNASEAIKTNVLGTKTIADLAVKFGVQKFVMISTDKAVNPTNVMGASKRIAEIYVQSLNKFINKSNEDIESKFQSGTKFITTRFGNVLGSNGSVIPRFKEQIEKGGPVTVTHPEITRYFMTIPEACRLVLEAGCMGKGGEIYIFDMGKSVKIIELAKRMIRLAGLTPNQDIKIEFSGLRPGEKLFEELLNNHENTMPTHHEKIMIGKVREYLFEEVETQIKKLINNAQFNDDLQVVKSMKQIVSEFRSKNSVFEQLDIVSKTN